MKRTVWTTGGCASWYLDAHGNNTTLWPRTTFAFRGELREFDADAYRGRALRTTDPRLHHHERDPRMKTLDDKVVVITGAGSGIGRALALNLAGKGSLLALSDVDDAGLAETVDLVKAAGARRSAATTSTSPTAPRSRRTPPPWPSTSAGSTWSINNAGVALAGDFADLEYDDIDWIVGINFWGVVHGTKEFLPHLIASGDGHVVNISSLFGLISMPGQSMYNATKYAVRGMTEALREEMLIAGHPVGVTAVHPGGIKTAIARNARVSAKEDKEATAKLFDKKLARMTPGAGRRDHRQRASCATRPGSWSASTPTPCTTSPSSPARATRTSSPGPRSGCSRRRPRWSDSPR